MFSVQEVVLFGVVAGVIAGGVLRATTWARERRRFVIAGAATAIGFIAWNLLLVGTNATGINVDIPLTPLSFQNLGSGVLAFAATAAVLGLLVDPDEPARRVVGAASPVSLPPSSTSSSCDLFVPAGRSRPTSMSKRSRQRIAQPTRDRPARRTQAPAARRIPFRPLIISSVVVLAVVAVVVSVLLANQGLPGIQTGSPPWRAETAQLRARLTAIGLPALTGEGQGQHTHQHLDLYVDGRQVVIPTDIGINRTAAFLSPIHTHDSTGIIHVESPVVRTFTLGEFFDVWGVRFDGHCIGGVCDSNGRVLSVYLNGQPYTGDPRALALTAHEEIVVAIGTAAQLPNPIPASYAFPAGL
jgi:hypothetical protein